MTPRPGIEPGPHWWEASALTTAPSLLFSLSDVFQGTYSLLLLRHLQFNSQKPCTVQQNRQNRNDGSKGRQTLLLSGHFCDFNSRPFRSIQCLLNTVSARYMILTSRAWVMWQSFYIPSHVMRH